MELVKTRVCRLHGPKDLRIETQDVAAPGPGEVLVRLGAGGICGSDLHYFHDGGFGPIRVSEPIILGHEVAGTVDTVGEGVDCLKPGDRVALNPSRPCGNCKFCLSDCHQHCLTMRFFGSALRTPHEQGAFRDAIVVPHAQCVPVGDTVSLGEAACAEPLAVCLHAVRRATSVAGDLAGKRVLVTGAGPIGVLCIAAARHAGASQIVATDIHPAPLKTAAAMGANVTVDVASGSLEDYKADKGAFDVVFECSASEHALRSAIACTRPTGTIVQVGVAGELAVPINAVVGKEINLIGSHRFHEEFVLAAKLIGEREIDVRPLISGTFALSDALQAFEEASDRSRAMKVQFTFSE